MMINKFVKTAEFIETETLHDAIVVSSDQDELEGVNASRLRIRVKFYIDRPEMKQYCNLDLIFDRATATAIPQSGFDIFDFEMRSASPLTFWLQDCSNGDEVTIVCTDSYIVLDDTFIEYLKQYDRPILHRLY